MSDPTSSSPFPDRPVSGPAGTAPAGQPWTPADFGGPEPYAEPVQPVGSEVTGRGASRLISVVLGFGLVIAVAGVAFAAGRVTAPPTVAQANRGFNGTFGNGAAGENPNASPGANRGAGRGGIFGSGGVTITGTVASIDGSQLQVTLANGTSVTIPLSSSTTYHTQAPATQADVKAGSTVDVQLSLGGGNGGGAGFARPSPGANGNSITESAPASSVTVVP